MQAFMVGHSEQEQQNSNLLLPDQLSRVASLCRKKQKCSYIISGLLSWKQVQFNLSVGKGQRTHCAVIKIFFPLTHILNIHFSHM